MAGQNDSRYEDWDTSTLIRTIRLLSERREHYIGPIQARACEPKLDRALAVSASVPCNSEIEGLQELVWRIDMHNLELHNKLLQAAKTVRELVEQHPELEPQLAHLETILAAESTAGPSHPIGSPLYRKGD